MMNRFRLMLLLSVALVGWTATTWATELVYRPVNPSFGGYPANGPFLLDSAQSQNKHTGPSSTQSLFPESSPLEDFEESLNRRILSIMADKIVDAAFGEDGLEEGHFVVGDYTIDVTNGTDGVNVTIVDPSTGNETTILVPSF